jgi:hypothetical protein
MRGDFFMPYPSKFSRDRIECISAERNDAYDKQGTGAPMPSKKTQYRIKFQTATCTRPFDDQTYYSIIRDNP